MKCTKQQVQKKRKVMRLFCFVFVFLVYTVTVAQPIADFTVPVSVCLNQTVTPDNNSTGTSYEWDFCQGDLQLTPIVAENAVSTGNVQLGIDVLFDGTNWFGFVTDATNNTIIRLSYGNSPDNTPTITPLGSIFASTVTPYDIKVVNDNGEWYGFVYGVSKLITRLDFGNALTNTPTSELVVDGSGTTSGLDVVYTDGAWHIAYTQNFFVTIIKLPAIESIPVAGDIKLITFADTSVRLGDIKLLEDATGWYGYSVSYDGPHSLHRISFGATLFNVGTPANITGSVISTLTPYGIDGGFDNGIYVLFVSTISGNLVRVDLGTNLSLAPSSETALGTFNKLGNTLKIILKKTGSLWRGFTISYVSGQVYQVLFPLPPCNTTPASSTLANPEVSYSTPGTRFITLRSFAGGVYDEVSESVDVLNSPAPSVAINVNGICVNNPSLFSFTSDQSINSVHWDFGNSTSSTDPSPSATYNSTGDFQVVLQATSANGCANTAKKTVSIFNPPSASFSLPVVSLVCTNQPYAFTNTSGSDPGSTPAWQWQVNGGNVANTSNLSFAFDDVDDYSVKLIASIPGCSSESTQLFTTEETGPSVDFTIVGNCVGTDVTFTNGTAGNVSSIEWDFGDGDTSTDTSPTHQYAAPGPFNVSLTASNAAGCENSKMTNLVIYGTPQPDFTLDLPPFSCSGSPSYFHDATPPLSDSNVNQWNWTFGDSQSGTGKDPTHTYSTAGAFSVRLSVTTDKGCTAFTDEEVNIAQSPAASFTTDPTCLNKPTRFTSTSAGDIESWQWRIGTQFYAVEDPVHQFTATGTFTVQLTVAGTNDCVSSVSRPAVVPVAPTVDFTVANACSAQATVFNDITSSAADPISQRLWTFNTAGTATTQQANFSFANAGTFPVKLDITNQSGCVYSLTRQVAIHLSPVANFTMSVESGPPPLHVSFANTSTGASSYQWNFNDGAGVKTESSQEYTYNALGEYDVDLTAIGTQGCKTSLTKTVHVIIPMEELALEEFSLVPSGSTYRGYVRVHNNGNYRIDGFSVTYDVGGGFLLTENVATSLSPGQTSMILLSNTFASPASAAYICAELQGDTNLSDNKACTVLNETAVVLTPYPNPADADLTIESVQPAAGTVRIRLYSSSGGIAYDKSFDVDAGLSRLTLDVQNLSPGMYVAVITAGGTNRSRHILIDR
jgi:PKD repeat protein